MTACQPICCVTISKGRETENRLMVALFSYCIDYSDKKQSYIIEVSA